ncbi:sensor histidine kinase [Kineosporia babensis]|uniref:histidine kinase n=1 Tax=Kineosporia babensis TaxID=499548 RepID=A0A9X1NIB6_9ACTN|nr:histidine kinase [Kineosporia babensis]MCD5314678.1 histidine kinase [Kineosporia babensis]
MKTDIWSLLRTWWPDLLAGSLLLLLGLVEAVRTSGFSYQRSDLAAAIIVLAMALAVFLARPVPPAALGLVWFVGLYQLVGGPGIMAIQFAIAYIAFAVARWGSTITLWLSALSLPLAVMGGLLFLNSMTNVSAVTFAGRSPLSLAADALGVPWPLMTAAFILTLLAVPWLIGLAVRLSVRASASQASLEVAEADAVRAQRETEQAREIAALREEQARLASDVHDVVGHSLAVILAQAESAQFLGDDPVVLKQTMATIATSARSSLQDIRQVLAGAQQAGQAAAAHGSYEGLIAGVRSGGHEVEAAEVGQSRPLPPELEVVAHRVVQEMLTNAIKHGRRERPVRIERAWPEGAWAQDLRIEVSNYAADSRLGDTRPIEPNQGNGGQGLEGMRRRLEAVGGKLDVRQRAEPEGQVFTVTAWIPVSGR